MFSPQVLTGHDSHVAWVCGLLSSDSLSPPLHRKVFSLVCQSQVHEESSQSPEGLRKGSAGLSC